MKKILTILVSYNFEPWIDKCIPSLINSSYPTDIIIIDNASEDNTVQILKENYPSIIIVESKENLGFGKANNIGIEYAIANGYDYVYLVNQDAWLEKNCILNLLESKAPTNTMLSPMHFDGTEKVLDRGFAKYLSAVNSQEELSKITFVNAAFWFIPLSVIKKIGLFSPIFYHYGEDKDFSNRLNFHHIDTYIVRNAKAFHDRQSREVNSGINYKAEFVYHLTEFCNINYNYSKAFSKAILAVIKKALKEFLKGNIHSAKKYFEITLQLWNKIGEVKKTRTKNKIEGSYFSL